MHCMKESVCTCACVRERVLGALLLAPKSFGGG